MYLGDIFKVLVRFRDWIERKFVISFFVVILKMSGFNLECVKIWLWLIRRVLG